MGESGKAMSDDRPVPSEPPLFRARPSWWHETVLIVKYSDML
ncbi:hypothetical Protein YC6258_01679 [Gynuella sunshinyii YC6258]|uniref:Uncharacterized protein n=1 Tax=Gynuella sunshinyii YC6258 TaxID=1445510 RepID=A0A0C5VGL3_9GAMM|nr:hypothetical Protein YC6258_01679 [Gynuella sunshinyii YC6258]